MDTTKLGEGREREDDLGRLAGGHEEYADLGHGDCPAEIVAPDAGRGFVLEGLGGRAGEGGKIQVQLKIVFSYLGSFRE